MKIKHAIMTFTFALVAGLGAIGVANLNKKVEVKEANAATATKLYIDMSACTGTNDWTSAGAQTFLRVFNSPASFYALTQVSGSYYTVTADISKGCQLVRVASGVAQGSIVDKSSNDGGSIWTYGSNYSSGNKLCVVSGYEANWESIGGGESETYETASTSPSASTKRIWLDPKDHFYDGSARAALRTFTTGGTHLKTYILGGSSQYIVVNGKTLFYVDIPANADGQLVRLHNVYNYIWTYGSPNISGISGYDTSKIIYSADAGANCSVANETTGITVAYAKLVLDGYSTCENSAVNGYKNIDNITTNVLSKLSASDLSSLRSATFDAPTYGERTYGDKIDLMNAKDDGTSSNSILPIIKENSNNVATVVIVISVLSISALGLFLFLKKRKESK